MKTVSASVPLALKTEAKKVLAAQGLTMTAVVRHVLGRVAEGDKQLLEWLRLEHESANKKQ